MKNMPQRLAQSRQQPMKEIHVLGSEIIATRTDDGRTNDGRTDDG